MAHRVSFLEGVEVAGGEVLGHHGVMHIHAVGVRVECGLGDAGDGEIGRMQALDAQLGPLGGNCGRIPDAESLKCVIKKD